MARGKMNGMRRPPRSRFPERDPAEPLRQRRQELFAKEFADTLNVKDAIRIAGYPARSGARVAGRLLGIEAMRKRIRYLQKNDPESIDTVKLVQSMYLDLRDAMAKAVVRNPFTSEVGLDFGRLSAREIAALEFKLVAKGGRLDTRGELSLHSGGAATLAALARIVSALDYAPERQKKASFSDLLRDLTQRNISSAPIRSNYSNDKDD